MLACLSFQLFQGHQANLAKLISLRPTTLFPAMHQPHPLCKSWNMKGSPLTVCTVYSSRSWSTIDRIRGSVAGVMWRGEGREGGSWLTKNRCTIYTYMKMCTTSRENSRPSGGTSPYNGLYGRGGSTKRYLFQGSGLWKGVDFTSEYMNGWWNRSVKGPKSTNRRVLHLNGIRSELSLWNLKGCVFFLSKLYGV